jgi:hypothetical protein
MKDAIDWFNKQQVKAKDTSAVPPEMVVRVGGHKEGRRGIKLVKDDDPVAKQSFYDKSTIEE